MSIKRYMASGSDVVKADENGPLVLFDDYAALHYERIHDLNQIGGLQEENARLKAEVERLDTLCKQLMTQHSDISCENIMLRKAGDAVAKRTEFFQKRWDADELCQEIEDWNAAKEGKPSV